MRLFAVVFFYCCAWCFTACDEPIFSPKPRGFPKVIYPERAYQAFDTEYCHFSFEYPTYADIQQDTLFFDEKPIDPCWFDIVIPEFAARIHCSYFPISTSASFDQLRSDAFEMVNKHNIKANYIDELVIQNNDEVGGIVFDIKGPAASPFQFYLTDSTKHFLRGALYFNTQARPDSLAPIAEFVKEDILHLIDSFAWEE